MKRLAAKYGFSGFRMDCLLLSLTLIAAIFMVDSFAQNGNNVYYLNFVKHADGTNCTHIPPQATFTAYLNSDQSRVLIETAPRWQEGTDPNIPGSGVFGVQLGNFISPPLAAGDSVHVRFTCNATGQQGVLSDSVTGIPWYYFNQHLYLSPVSLPSPPQNVSLTLNAQHQRVLTWSQEPGVTYSVYRQVVQDTIFNGKSRRLYHRIAQNLTTNSFIDTSTTDTVVYGYIVYAISGNGIISSHSQEIVGGEPISNFTAVPRATTAMLSWSPYTPPIGTLKGYNIYRRTDAGSYGSPVAYTGPDTSYMDSRLTLNTFYHYKITARIDEVSEFGETETTITTLPSQSGFYKYANLKIAVVVYQNTNGGAISDMALIKIKKMLKVARLFYWRNSKMKLNVELTYFPITDYRDFGDPNNLNIQMTVNDLKALGVMNTQYDIIFRVTPATLGYWSVGVTQLGLPGPPRLTGFSQSYWPVNTGVVYPGNQSGIDYGLTWTFVHEAQHAIDALYDANGQPQMYHGDLPWEFPVACGEHLDFQAKMFRTFSAYQALLPSWGDIYEAVDADEDDFPDDDPMVLLDEARFGSSSLLIDTDGDNYSDRLEAIDGTYGGSNPTDTDTDGDSIADGQDSHPRYPVQTGIQLFTPVIDGSIESGWPLVNQGVIFTQELFSPKLYVSYSPDSLYLALRLPAYGIPRITFDFHADGWWHSSGNTVMKIDPVSGTFMEFRSWDASDSVKNYSLNHGGPGGMWDTDSTYQQQFNRRVIYPDSVNLKVSSNSEGYQIEMAIPKNHYAGIYLQSGDSVGVNTNYSKVNNSNLQWAVTFDQYSFVNLVIGGGTGVAARNDAPVIDHFSLKQNYPNPFNPLTHIQYTAPAAAEVEIAIYNTLGQKIRTLISGDVQPGIHSVIWNGKDDQGEQVASGIYLYRLKSGNRMTLTKKMILLR